MMKTLYDLLGALPHDDAEDLRTAFRTAVKGAHPDVRPGDPDAAIRFREIVRAHEILSDGEQREAYDHLLELARLEQEPPAGHALARTIHKLASGVIALAGISAVMVGGYLLFMHISSASVASANNVEASGVSKSWIAGFDPALQLDAKSLPAYFDPGIVFYRSEKFDGGGFPDIAPAKASRLKPVPAVARKPSLDHAVAADVAMRAARLRRAAQDPSRLETVAQMR
jgi:curved DNA-binding protein CbpA